MICQNTAHQLGLPYQLARRYEMLKLFRLWLNSYFCVLAFYSISLINSFREVSASLISQLSATLLYINDFSFPWMTGQTEDGINFRLLRSNIRTVTGVSPDLNLHHHSHLAHFLLNLSHLIRFETTTPPAPLISIFLLQWSYVKLWRKKRVLSYVKIIYFYLNRSSLSSFSVRFS